MINKDNSLVSIGFNSLYASAEVDGNSTWPAIETAYPFKQYMNDAFCEIFNNGRWDELYRSAVLTVKNQNSENLIFQLVRMREKVINHYKSIRLEEINRSRNGIVIDTLNFVDFVEIINRGSVILEAYEGFFSLKMQFKPDVGLVNNMNGKRGLH